jgi:hypothetical protein
MVVLGAFSSSAFGSGDFLGAIVSVVLLVTTPFFTDRLINQ